jgi:hypothetical protein
MASLGTNSTNLFLRKALVVTWSGATGSRKLSGFLEISVWPFAAILRQDARPYLDGNVGLVYGRRF